MDTFFAKIKRSIPIQVLDTIDIEEYSSSKISIIKVKNAFSAPNSFAMFKFILPLTKDYPFEIVEKNYYQLKKNHLFPINPGQLHCSETYGEPIIEIKPFLAIFIDKNFMQMMSKKLFNNREVIFDNINNSITVDFRNILNKFIEEINNKPVGYELMIENLDKQIAISLLRDLDNNLNKKFLNTDQSDKKSINKAIYFINNNYDKELSLEEVAATANYSPYHFIRVFKEETGKTPFQYLLDIKIDKAKEKLYNSNKTISDICYECGFNNRSHFSFIFKRKTGNSPSEYREIIANSS
ncbi:MAG TPA: AraC family transcriptional regulator [Halanaerobiales bacterium]|nr:AraC family transcriptional regulator [Halanaerobiales bacterium]